jgi:hypothetical protein
MVLKHLTRSTQKIVDPRRTKLSDVTKENNALKKTFTPIAKLDAARREISTLKKTLKKTAADTEKRFDFGFALSLILLTRSFPNLEEQACNIFDEAGYSLPDFDGIDLDPTDRETLNKIFSV